MGSWIGKDSRNNHKPVTISVTGFLLEKEKYRHLPQRGPV
jgi:hypothetical protein